jgi:hypothetical protein
MPEDPFENLRTGFSPKQRYQLRLEKAKPILDEMKDWLDKSAPQSNLGKALTYMQQ